MNQLHSCVLVSGPYTPDHKVRLQSNFGDAPRCRSRLRPAERNVAQISNNFSRKSGDDIPVSIANAIVRIQNPETVNRAIVQIANGQPGNRNRRLALQVRNFYLLLFCFLHLLIISCIEGTAPLSGGRLPFTPCAVR